MTKQCAMCGKRSNQAWRLVKLRGKFNPTIKRKQRPNLQWVRLTMEQAKKFGLSATQRIKACTKCIKSLAK